MPEDIMLQEAIQAIRQGKKGRARDLLTRLLRADQSNPHYWLWMSAAVDTDKERAYCLQTALRLEPQNEAARRGLIFLGLMRSEVQGNASPLVRRPWQVETLQEPSVVARPLGGGSFFRLIAVFGAGALLLALLLAGILGVGGRSHQAAARPTRTPGPPPTFTNTPTFVRTPRPQQSTPTPLPRTLAPLWALLEATYTPTPLYVNTPHPISEDYRLAQRAFARGDWQTALRHFKNAAQAEPNAADVQYYLGEVLRQMGDYAAALEAYAAALELNPAFAPAYLGQARLQLALDPQADVSQDLAKAIEYDPNLGEAYLERAAFLLRRGDVTAAQADLEIAETLLPQSALLPLYRARASLLQGNYATALEQARQAYEADRTLLPAYLTLGVSALANSEFALASQVLQTYVQYAPEDPQGWLALGQAYALFSTEQQAYLDFARTPPPEATEQAQQAFEQALKLEPRLASAYLYRALLYLIQDQGQKAVNDLMAARRLEPNSFSINLGLGRALMAAGRLDDALAQVDSCQKLAQDESQQAAVYYWRATINQARRQPRLAAGDWQALLDLSPQSVPNAWRQAAQVALLALTPTSTMTPTPSPTLTPTDTRTPRPTPSLTPTAGGTFSGKTTPSLTPTPGGTLSGKTTPSLTSRP